MTYASAMKSLIYAMFYTRPDINYAVNLVSKHHSNLLPEYWIVVKILKYLKRMKHYSLVFRSEDLIVKGYIESKFQSDVDNKKSTLGFVFLLGKGARSWRSYKQDTIADSTIEASI